MIKYKTDDGKDRFVVRDRITKETYINGIGNKYESGILTTSINLYASMGRELGIYYEIYNNETCKIVKRIGENAQ